LHQTPQSSFAGAFWCGSIPTSDGASVILNKPPTFSRGVVANHLVCEDALCGPAGADGARTLLEQSSREEEAMAAWVDQNVAKVTLAYLNKQQRAAA
jgi:hypothetical protein